MGGSPVDGSYYYYAPNKGAAVFFAIVFFASGYVHLHQTIMYRCTFLTFLFPFCCLLFSAGFCLRAYGAWHYDELKPYIASICITYAAPPLLELQNYRILGRILYYAPYNSPIHPGRVLTTFGFISAIVESLNGWGASYSANKSLSDSQIAAGHALIKASLIIQVFVAAAFISVAVSFHRRCASMGLRNRRLRIPLLTLYTSTGLILIRTIYRIVEYFSIAQVNWKLILNGQNFDWHSLSPIIRYEWFFYVFEAAVMSLNCILFNVFHPRRYLPRNNKIYLAMDGVTEVEGPGFEDGRPFWMTLIDPFDLNSLIRGKRSMQMDRFWEVDEGGTALAASNRGAGSAERKDSLP